MNLAGLKDFMTQERTGIERRPASGREREIFYVVYLFMTGKKKSGTPEKKKWSADVTEHSDALDLKDNIFKGTAKEIAQSLKKSAEASKRRKSSPYRSAMSMLTFYINRGGKNLSDAEKKNLEKAKDELRAEFGREPAKTKKA